MRADIHEIEAAGDHLQDLRGDEQADDAAEAAVWVHTAEDGGKDCDQQVRRGDIRSG